MDNRRTHCIAEPACMEASRGLLGLCHIIFYCAPQWVVLPLWFLAEVAIAATDLAEIIGSATALNLLFNIPLWVGVLITAVDVLFIIAFGMKNFRVLEVTALGSCPVSFSFLFFWAGRDAGKCVLSPAAQRQAQIRQSVPAACLTV